MHIGMNWLVANCDNRMVCIDGLHRLLWRDGMRISWTRVALSTLDNLFFYFVKQRSLQHVRLKWPRKIVASMRVWERSH
jgi:hypothetical protein